MGDMACFYLAQAGKAHLVCLLQAPIRGMSSSKVPPLLAMQFLRSSALTEHSMSLPIYCCKISVSVPAGSSGAQSSRNCLARSGWSYSCFELQPLGLRVVLTLLNFLLKLSGALSRGEIAGKGQ